MACAGLVALSLVALSAHDVNGILVLSALEVRLGADAVRPDTTATGLPREANPSDPAPTDAAYHDASNNLVRREFGAQLRSNGDLSRTIDRWNSTHRDDRGLREWLARRPRWKPAETSHTRPADVATSTTPRTERSSSPAEAVAAVESHLRTCGSDCADIVEDANRAAAEAFESESVGESIVAAAMDFGGGSDFADAMFGEGLFGKLFARAFGETMESIGGNAFAAVAGKINAKLDDRRRMAEAARQRVRDAVASIRENAHGEMPAPEIDNSWTDPSGGARISNDTQYTVTVSFVGPTSRTVSIAPHETVRVLLSPGQYEEAARASAPDVLPFYGSFAQPRGRGLAQRFYIAER